ncbi:DUF1134 domain-containing protein [Solidesulfovibrio sp. C21]|uniref:DUF1134 domain-containing protein n=1 Tax=Solidesulfovibrio sp. C21 TaxID=3398613 RepID=UPI0039FC33AB
MQRFTATIVLAVGCVFVLAAAAGAQDSLKERSLSDTPAPAHTAPGTAAQPATGQSRPGAATVSPVPAPATGQPAAPRPQPGATSATPASTQVPVQGAYPAATPPPHPAGAVPPGGQPTDRPSPPSGATPINGQTNLTPPPPPPAGGAPLGGQPAGSPPSSPPGGATPINGQTNFTPPPPPPPPPPTKSQTYNRNEVNREVMGFFESGSRGLAEMVARSFHDLGQPSGFIKGNEAGGALIVGLRYGTGTLYLKGRKPIPVYWQSPSIGFDLGVNAGKVFTLVYGLTSPDQLFQRFPGVDGSVYILGGFGMNYQRTEGITLAPIRFGVGLRLGANVGYQDYTRTQQINPF